MAAAAYHFAEVFLTRVDALSFCRGETVAMKMLVLASAFGATVVKFCETFCWFRLLLPGMP